jgi:hypothetical protein
VIILPGSIHDCKAAVIGRVYDKLENVYRRNGAKCTADSAFAAKNVDYIIRSLSTVDIESDGRVGLRNRIRVNKEATSMRQSAEWGMYSLKSFPRLKDWFLYEEYGERRLNLTMLVLLFNLRARKVGINQIRTVYMPNLERNAYDYFVGPLLNE